jgi:biofilm PGA synthesis lipoprotein PgaB
MALELSLPRPLRAAHVDLDYVYDPDPAQAARNLDRLLDRIQAMQLSAVFLQAFADDDGDGVANALYFPNRHLPMRADLFNRVAWQLKTRADVKVFAWMPVLAFELPESADNEALAVQSDDGSHTERYHRLSPFHPDARRIIQEIYTDLGRSVQFAGVLFHDDGFLTDREDVSAAALKFYRENWNVDVVATAIGATSVSRLAARKTRFLIEFTQILSDRLRRYQPALLTARNLYASVLTDPQSEAWFAQNFELFLTSYDFTAVMAMPMMEGVDNHSAWLAGLLAKARAVPGAMERTLFELQSVDWRNQQPVSARVLAAQMDLLLDGGARHIAYYPDDFITGHPPLELIRSRLSVNDYPTLKE